MTPGDPMDCSLPGSFVHGIFQARVLDPSRDSRARTRSPSPRAWANILKVAGSKQSANGITDIFIINRVACAHRHTEEGRTNGAVNAGDTNSVPGQGTKIPCRGQKKKFNVNSNFLTPYLFVSTSKEYIDRFKEFHLQRKTFLYALL